MDMPESSEGLERTQVDPTCPEYGTQPGPHCDPDNPDVAHVVDAWPGLPEHIRQAILTLVESARQKP